MAKKKPNKDELVSKEDFRKAIDEAYALGFKHGQTNKKTIGILDPKVETELQIFALHKSIDENGKKINSELIKRHREQVGKHMKKFAEEADEALKVILESHHKHGDK